MLPAHGVPFMLLIYQCECATARYQASMLRSLKEVQVDDSVVGFYQAMSLGSFYSQSLVETQAIHQDKLRHGGVVIVHGTHNPLDKTRAWTLK